MHTSRKLELGRYLCEIDWSLVEQTSSCEEKLKLFESFVKTGLDIITPIKKSQVHIDDSPWVTPEFKRLIKLRQKAFSADNSAGFRHYRNAVNRERKVLRANYLASKVSYLKQTKSCEWWNAVKRIFGMTPSSGGDSLLSNLQFEGYDHLLKHDIANLINSTFGKLPEVRGASLLP